MAVQILPNAVSQFCDINGAPLVGGFVYHYVPDSDTPKDTWQDPDQDALNSNPIVLDERGQARIWGTGMYRQRVLDADGNEIWDAVTEAPCSCDDDGSDTSGNFYEATLYWPLDIQADDVVMLWPFAQDVSFPDNFAGFAPQIITPPGSTTVYTITRIAADTTTDTIGSMTITDAGVITVATTATPEFEAQGAMKITAPADPDGAAGLAVTFIGTPVAA